MPQRLSAILVAALSLAALGNALPGCASDERSAIAAPNVIAPTAPPIKFLVAKGKLHALVKESASPSAVLYVRMRRIGSAASKATIGTRAITTVGRCDEARAEGAAIPLAAAAPIAGDDYVLAGGPDVDEALLRTVYPPNAAGHDLAALIGETHTAVVEGCVFAGERLVASSVEELADAADDGACGLPEMRGARETGGPSGDGGPPSNPNLRDSCVGRADGIYCSQLDDAAAIVCQGEQIASGQQCIDGARCTGPNGSGERIVCSPPTSGNGFRSLRPRAVFQDGRYQCTPEEMKGKKAYTNACERALGELPMFAKKADGSHERFSCIGDAKMKIVPVSLTEAGATTTIDGSVTGALDAVRRATTETCDAPAWLGYSGPSATQCAPFSRAGKFTNEKSDFVVICRRYAVRGKDDPRFDDINIIGSNRETGETCFWNTHLNGIDAAKGIPHPADDVATDAKWMTVGDLGGVDCVQCHDADPWMHSPWIDQVGVVPKGARAKYKLVAGDSLEREGNAAPGSSPTHWTSLEVIDEPEAKPCTTCHRIGKLEGARTWTARSTGVSMDRSSDPWWVFASAFARTYTQSRWMPADDKAPPEADWPTSSFAKAVKKIEACGADPASCRWTKL